MNTAMKHFLSLFLSLLIPLMSFAQEIIEVDGLKYYLYSSTMTASLMQNYDNEYSGDIVIPSTVNYSGENYTVTTILDYAFNYCSEVTSVVIPNTVTYIGNQAFCFCSALSSLTMSENVETISNYAFQGCSSLNGFTIPAATTSIGYDVFIDCYFDKDKFVNNSALSAEDNNYWGAKLVDSRENGLIISNNEVIKYNGTATSVTVPEGVTSIGEGAFSSNQTLTEIVLPSTLKKISENAFNYVTSLESINIPSGVTEIGSNAFNYCTNLKTAKVLCGITEIPNSIFNACIILSSVTLPETITKIGNYAFSGCNGLSSLNIPSKVTQIGNYAFQNCTNLDNITLPEGLTNIKASAFYGCSALSSINIPASVTSIGNSTFLGCSGLTSITVAEGNTVYDSRNNCNAIIQKSNNELLIGCNNTTIPDGVEILSSNAFNDCKGLTTISIPNSVTNIRYYCFNGCSNLETVTIGTGLQTIEHSVFYYCSKLSSVNLPEGVTSIGNSAFYDCSELSTITIPSTVTSIGYSAFEGCYFSKSDFVNKSDLDAESNGYWGATIVDSKKDGFVIQDGKLLKYTGEATEIVIPDGVTSIGDAIFKSEQALTITAITIPASVTEISSYAFSSCYIVKDKFINNTELTDYNNWGAKLVTSRDNGLIINYTTIVKYVGTNPNVTIPADITYIDYYAFSGADFLENIYIMSTVPPSMYNAFSSYNATLHVIKGCKDVFASHDYWGKFTNIVDDQDPKGSCGENTTYVLNTDTWVLTLSGTGEVTTSYDAPWKGLASKIKGIVIGEGITGISYNAFSGCVLMKSDFVNNSSLNSENNNYWSATVFDKIVDGFALTYSKDGTVTLQKYYGSAAVINIPSDVTSISNNVFEDNTTIKSVVIPDGVIYIGSSAFSGCTNLTTVNLPEGIGSINSNLFYNCSSLANITIPDAVSEIYDNAFENCSSLKEINIPAGVNYVGWTAFEGCTSLENIYVKAMTPPNMSEGTFSTYDATLHVIKGQKEVYSNSQWGKFTNIVEDQTFGGKCGKSAYYAMSEDGTTLQITGSGDMYDYQYINTTPWSSFSENITKVEISDDITSIGNFALCAMPNISSVTLPSKLKKIGGFSFARCEGLTSLSIPNGVTTIGGRAFMACLELASISFPSSLTEIGEGAFDGTKWIENQPEGLLYIGTVLYKYNGKMPKGTSIDIKSGTKTIGSQAFSYCEGLTAITIPSSVTKIMYYAFANCYGLAAITIPASVTEIEDYAFEGCYIEKDKFINNSSLDEKSNEYWGATIVSSRADGFIIVDNVLIKYIGEAANVTIPNGVTEIARGAFQYNRTMKSVVIPNTVTAIRSQAFYGCSGLEGITIPESMKEIDSYAFVECYFTEDKFINNSSLNPKTNNNWGATIVDSRENGFVIKGDVLVKYVGDATTITIPNSITTIGESAFSSNNESITSVTMPEGVTTIESRAFSYCTNLATINFPESLEEIKSYALEGTAWYNNQPDGVVYAGCIAYSYKGSGDEQFSIEIKEGTKGIASNMLNYNSNLISVTLPESVIRIGDYAFYYNSNLAEVNFAENNNIEYVGHSAFDSTPWYDNLEDGNIYIGKAYYKYKGTLYYGTKIEIKPGTVSISGSALYGQNYISEITIPSSVKEIGTNAFSYCNYLDAINVYAKVPPTLGDDIVSNYYVNLHVVKGYKDAYTSDTNWSKFKNIYDDLSESVRGDANGDGEITVADVMFIVNYILGSPDPSFDSEGADANLDGEITVADVMYDVQYILTGDFPVEE